MVGLTHLVRHWRAGLVAAMAVYLVVVTLNSLSHGYGWASSVFSLVLERADGRRSRGNGQGGAGADRYHRATGKWRSLAARSVRDAEVAG